MRAKALAVLAIVAGYGEVAAAEPARVILSYARREATATTCPDEATFRTLVIARLGYDPFNEAGDLTLEVDFRPQGPETAGSFVLRGKAGDKRSERTLRDADCFEIASSLALSTAIAVDPDAVRVGATPPSDPPPPKEPPERDPPPEEPPPKPKTAPPDDRPPSPWSPTSPRARITATFVIPVGLTPAVGGGVRVGLGVEGHVWSLVAEGAVLFPTSATTSFGSVTSWVAHGSLVPCAHLPVHRMVLVDLCAVGSLGGMFSDAEDVSRSDPQTHLFAAVGPRAGLTVMPWRQAGFAATFDVPVNLERAHLFIEDEGQPREVWAASRVGFEGGLGLVLHLP